MEIRQQFTSTVQILLASNNAEMRDSIKRLLSQQYAVETVTDGVTALAAVRQQVLDLLLADVMMPGLDGFELLRSLRANPQTRELPVILLSACAGEESRIKGLEAGADAYLSKPFSTRELLACIEATLKLAQVRQEAARYEQTLRIETETAHRQISIILESITDAFVAFDQQWRYTYVNEQAERLLHKTRNELLGKQVWEEVFPETVGTLAYRELHRAVNEQVAVVFEEFGEPVGRWLEIHAYPSPEGVAVYFRDISDRKQAEATLRESEEFNRSIFESSADCIKILDLNGCILSMNTPGLCLMEIEDCTAVIGKPWSEFWQDPDRNTVCDAIEIAKAGGTRRFSGYCPTAKGMPKWWDVIVTPIFDAQGDLKRLMSTSRDITEHKRAEEALIASEARLRSFVEANVVGILFGDVYGSVREANDELLKIVGYRREDLRSGRLRWTDITPPEYLYLDELGIAEAQARGACTPYEKEYICKDGSRVQVLVGYSLVGETREECVAFILDISNRKQTEAALRESEDRLRLAMESAELGTWDLNPVSGVLKWDAGCKAMFGLSPDAEVNYEVFLAGVHPEDIERTQQAVQWALSPASGGEYNIEYRTVGIEDGVERWIAAQGKAYFNSAKEAVRFIGTVLNITDRKRIAAEREQLLERERAALATSESANRVKDEFLAVLSHELRSPLNPIMGWSKLLRSHKLDEKTTDRALETIERNAQIQAQLIEDLLDVSRILRGKLSLNVSSVDLVSTIQAAIETVRLAAEAKAIQIQTLLESDMGQVSGDASRLQQIVWNLLSNAVKFTPPAGRVDIRLERFDSQAQIIVSDTGKGIHPDFLPYVFDYFRQADSTTTRTFGGLGLGLAIVRQLVELHGGTVRADSPGEGQGATFTVRFPLITTQPKPDEKRQSEQSLDLNGVKVLLVDDDENTREFVAFLLEIHGASVIAVDSAGEAFAALTQSQPDVLLSDIGMPDVDGYMLIRQVRTLPPQEGGQIPAITLTAYAGEINQQQALAAGFQRHVSKPVEPGKLVAAIASLIRREKRN